MSASIFLGNLPLEITWTLSQPWFAWDTYHYSQKLLLHTDNGNCSKNPVLHKPLMFIITVEAPKIAEINELMIFTKTEIWTEVLYLTMLSYPKIMCESISTDVKGFHITQITPVLIYSIESRLPRLLLRQNFCLSKSQLEYLYGFWHFQWASTQKCNLWLVTVLGHI